MEASITIPCGESPTLVDVVAKDSISLTGSAIGIIKPKTKAIFGQKLQAGDSIYGLISDGIHTNGLSLARKIVEKLPNGYFTKFGNHTIGEELLKPTKIYVKPVLEMLKKHIDIHYMSNISGSAFRKISRAKKEFTYSIEKLPPVPKILSYLQKLDSIPDKEAYETWNMGLGFVIIAPEKEESKIQKICSLYNQNVLKIGFVAKGKKQVIIRQKDIIF
jgi:phosphoribosylformylglycinamidine cyclo-ligase